MNEETQAEAYSIYDPAYNSEVEMGATNVQFITIDERALRGAKSALNTLINLLLEKQSDMLKKVSTVYEVRAALDKVKKDLKDNRLLLTHLEELLGKSLVK